MEKRTRGETTAARRTVAGLGLVCLLAGLIAALRANWICDDAYISFRYARNLVEGLGLVFNPGERVEGYSNFLWTIWSALAIRLGFEPRLWAQGWGIACYGASILLLATNHLGLRKALGISGISLPLGAAIAALHPEWIVYASGGLETSCFTLLALIGFLLLVGNDGKDGGRPLAAGVILGLLALTRPDGVIFAAVGGLFVLWDARGAGSGAIATGLRFAGGFAVLWLPFTLWRLFYYGDFLPNTYYAKSADLFWVTQGWIYVRLFFAKYWVLLPALPLAWIAVTYRTDRSGEYRKSLLLRQTVLATGFVLVYTLYVIKVGGDFMFGRFLVPIVPFLALLCDIGLLRTARQSGVLQIGIAVLVALALLFTPQPIAGKEIVYGIADEPRHYTEEYLKQVATGAEVLERYLDGLDVSVAFTGSEARLMYEARVPRAVECETGLTDRTVARQVLTERGRVGHEKHATIDYIVRERKTHLAFKRHTLQILDAGGRIPDSRILLEDSDRSPGKPVQGFVLHWDPQVMAALKRRGAVFRDFPTDLDKVIAGLHRLSRQEVERVYTMSRLFYFDHVDDPRRRQAFEDRLQAGDRVSVSDDDARPVLSSRMLLGWLLGIVALTFVCYLPALDADFIWDDNDWLTENPLVTEPGGLIRIWSGVERLQYYPVLFTAFRIEYLLWGLNPAGYHAVNVTLHASNAFLLGWLLCRLRIRGAWWVALLFAVHPVHVESVAWVTELKNVLSGLFYLATLHWFVESDERGKRPAYLLALLCFAASTLTKTATVTLPAVLLLILVWKKRGLTRADLYRLVPFFLVGGALAAVTVHLEKGMVAVVRQDFLFSWLERTGIAARALFFYPWKLVVPHPLIFNYPRWNVSAFAWSSVLSMAAVLLLAGSLALLWKHGRRGTVYAVLFYVVTILPALGFFDVYAFRYSFVADHFQYLASIGLLILLVQAGLRFVDAAGGRKAVWPRVAGAGVVLLLAGLSFAQARVYRDVPTLWLDTVAKNPDSWIGHHSLARHFNDRGSPEQALHHADEAIRCKPGSAESHTARAQIRAGRNELDLALIDLDRAVELDPSYPQARLDRATLLLALKRAADAAVDLDWFLSANPDYAPALHNRGRARVMLGQYEAALTDLDRAVRLGAGTAARIDRGSVHAQLRRFDLAREDAETAIRLDGENARAYLLLGIVDQMERGDRPAACSAWRRACELGDCRYFEQRCTP